MMFGLVETITLNAFSPLDSRWECNAFLLSAILLLRNTRIYICTSDNSNVASYIEAPINQLLHFLTTLNIPNVHLDDGYIWFGRNFDNTWLQYQNDIVDDATSFDDFFNHT